MLTSWALGPLLFLVELHISDNYIFGVGVIHFRRNYIVGVIFSA